MLCKSFFLLLYTTLLSQVENYYNVRVVETHYRFWCCCIYVLVGWLLEITTLKKLLPYYTYIKQHNSTLKFQNQPPTRSTVNRLFDACDADNSGGIDRNEFNIISGVCCAQLLGRLSVYYGCSIFLIPNLTQFVLTKLDHQLEPGGYAIKALEQFVQTIFFFFIATFLWDRVDKTATNEAVKSSREFMIRQNSGLNLDSETEATLAAVTASASEYQNKRESYILSHNHKRKQN